MVHPYLRRRDGLEPKEQQPEEISKVLDRTLGVPIFQEQVIQLVMVAAGFSAGEADGLRRAMATWKVAVACLISAKKLLAGCLHEDTPESSLNASAIRSKDLESTASPNHTRQALRYLCIYQPGSNATYRQRSTADY